jgi:hypothetical protein
LRRHAHETAGATLVEHVEQSATGEPAGTTNSAGEAGKAWEPTTDWCAAAGAADVRLTHTHELLPETAELLRVGRPTITAEPACRCRLIELVSQTRQGRT